MEMVMINLEVRRFANLLSILSQVTLSNLLFVAVTVKSSDLF